MLRSEHLISHARQEGTLAGSMDEQGFKNIGFRVATLNPKPYTSRLLCFDATTPNSVLLFSSMVV